MLLNRYNRKVLLLHIKDSLYYPDRLFISVLTLFSRCVVLILLYAYVFDISGDQVAGITLPIAAWSMYFYFQFSQLGLRELHKKIMSDVRSGSFEQYFTKPISYLGFRLWSIIGNELVGFIVTTITGCLLLSWYVGIPSTMMNGLFFVSFFTTFLLSAIVSAALYTMVGLAAFWIEDVNPIFWMVDKSVMILGGSYLPIAFFPETLQFLAKILPFGAARFVSHTPNIGWGAVAVEYILIQLGWAVILSLTVWSIFSLAQKRVTVNGG